MSKTTANDRPTFELAGADELSLATFRAFRDAIWAHKHALAKQFEANGAHMGQAACLRVLHGGEGCTQRDMADILRVSPPSITGMLQAMEKNGAIVRKRDEADQRLTRVYLTDKGRAMAADLRRVLAAYIMQTVGQMPEADRRELVRLLSELNEKIASATATERKAENE
jgi:DNA-binding MarR family transcriptional regulator